MKILSLCYDVINIKYFFNISFQGEYIKHPVILYELSNKYGLSENMPEHALPNRLEEIKEAIRREIRKELKVKNRAYKLFIYPTFLFINLLRDMSNICKQLYSPN